MIFFVLESQWQQKLAVSRIFSNIIFFFSTRHRVTVKLHLWKKKVEKKVFFRKVFSNAIDNFQLGINRAP